MTLFFLFSVISSAIIISMLQIYVKLKHLFILFFWAVLPSISMKEVFSAFITYKGIEMFCIKLAKQKSCKTKLGKIKIKRNKGHFLAFCIIIVLRCLLSSSLDIQSTHNTVKIIILITIKLC